MLAILAAEAQVATGSLFSRSAAGLGFGTPTSVQRFGSDSNGSGCASTTLGTCVHEDSLSGPLTVKFTVFLRFYLTAPKIGNQELDRTMSHALG